MKITLEEAGVDPNHQTDHCDFCNCKFKKGEEKIKTCTHVKYVTLCRKCYNKAGNDVR